METNVFLNGVEFFNHLTFVEHDVTTESERLEQRLVLEVEYIFNNKSYRTKKLYYRNILFQDHVKDAENIRKIFGHDVYWLDIERQPWPAPSGIRLDETVVKDMTDDTNFKSLLYQIANDNKNGWLQKLTWHGRSAQYGHNLENNNHWHDVIRLVKSIIQSEGKEVDKTLFSRLVFEWDNDLRKSLYNKHFGARKLIDELYYNIKRLVPMINESNIVNLLKYKKQIILQGPPGTGKTRLAKRISALITENGQPQATEPAKMIDRFFQENKIPDEKRLSHRKKIETLFQEFYHKFPAKSLKNITLEEYAFGTGSNDSFCYWIEYQLHEVGIYTGEAGKFKIYWKKDTEQYVKSGFLKDIKDDEEAMRLLAEQLQNVVDEKDLDTALQKLSKGYILKLLGTYHRDKYFPVNKEICLNNILKIFGIPHNGKSLFEKNMAIQERFSELRKSTGADVTNYEFMYFLFDNFSLKDSNFSAESSQSLSVGETTIIQFHPSYTYEDFVRGIASKIDETSKGVYYEPENKILGKIIKSAIDHPRKNFALIIDEINRANLSTVLGELIYALEYRYFFNAPESEKKQAKVTSLYAIKEEDGGIEPSNELCLPENLFIIGTMNTADRSVGHIDYAIRRRFAFVDIPAKDLSIELGDDFKANHFQEVAKIFEKHLSPEFDLKHVQLGHSYFIQQYEKDQKSSVDKTKPIDFNLRVKFEIVPILKEYMRDGILMESAKVDIQKIEDSL